jgi:Fe-S cluster assembly protein SufD
LPAFDKVSLDRIADSAPPWRREQMAAAYKTFTTLEEPTGAEEDWRYVDFDLKFADLAPVTEPGDTLEPGPFVSSLTDSSGMATLVDGRVVDAASDGIGLRRPGDLTETPFSGVSVDHNKLAAAHTAFASDGLYLDMPPGRVIDAPFVIDVQGVSPGTASFPHIAVDVGENAEAQVVVVYRSAPGADLLMVPEVAVNVGQGGRLRLLSVQSLDHAGSIVVHQRLRLGRDATGRLGEVGLGGDFARLDLGITLEGDGASAETVGLYFGEGAQTLDYRMLIDHVGKSTTSDVFLKGAVEDDARSVFTGLLRIEKDARKTNTFETNRNLVLSENAKANSVPNLEILCDDVVCGHGSSVGPLDEEHLYYLQSRGLRKARAERLLIKGFFQEVIDRLPISGLEEQLSREVFRRFVVAQEEGRVA